MLTVFSPTFTGKIKLEDQDPPEIGYEFWIKSQGTPFYVRDQSLYVMKDALDYETSQWITVEISVSEIGTFLSKVQNLHIQVTDINERPCCLRIDGRVEKELKENVAVRETVGILSVQDEDHEDEHSFQFSNHRKRSLADTTYFR